MRAACLFILCLLCAHSISAQSKKPRTFYYESFSINAGIPYGFNLSTAVLLNRHHEISLGYERLWKGARNAPADLDIRFGDYTDKDILEAATLKYAYVVYPRKYPEYWRFLIKGGLAYGVQDIASGYQPNPNYTPQNGKPKYLYSNDTKNTFAFTLNPTIVYTRSRALAFTAGLYGIASRDFLGGGLTLGAQVGKVTARKKHPEWSNEKRAGIQARAEAQQKLRETKRAIASKRVYPTWRTFYYGNVSLNTGAPIGLSASIATLFKKHHEISAGCSAFSQYARNSPGDLIYGGKHGGFDKDVLEGFTASYAYIMYPHKYAEYWRFALRAGVLIGEQSIPVNYRPNPDFNPNEPYGESNYLNDYDHHFATALLVNPSIVFTANRNLAVTAGLYGYVNKDFTGYGASAGILFGKVSNKKSHPSRIREWRQRRIQRHDRPKQDVAGD